MKSLTTYDKIFLGCVAVLACVLGFYLGNMMHKWVKQSWSVKDSPQIGSSVQAYPSRIYSESKGNIHHQGEAFTVAEVEVYPDACNCPGNVKLLATTYNGETMYKVERCLWATSTLGYPEKTRYEWQEVLEPTTNKEKATKEYNDRKKEYEKNEATKKREAEISKLKWKVVK